MCYYKEDKAIREQLIIRYDSIQIPIDYRPMYYDNGYDYNNSLVLTLENPKAFEYKHWGLIPHWVKSTKEGLDFRKNTLNCKSEEMFAKSSFRESLKLKKRCLIPATGYFEWHHLNKIKYPFYFHLKDELIFSFLGLYWDYKDRATGETISTYTILTTTPNPLVAKIHNNNPREPIIISKEYEMDWLNPNLTDEDVMALCQPFDENKMEAYSIGNLISNRKIKSEDKQTPAVAAPVEYPELKMFGL